jgi:hypothetical protein
MANARTIRTARWMVAAFWFFTVVYLTLITALMITLHDALGVIFIAILACSWFFIRLPDAKPHFAVLRDARRIKESSGSK